jgi:hypothetical protein
METLVGFMVGYLVGTRQGRDGMRRTRESFDAIRTSPDVRQLVATGAAIAGSTAKQLLSGGAGPLLAAVSRRAAVLMNDEDRRAA